MRLKPSGSSEFLNTFREQGPGNGGTSGEQHDRGSLAGPAPLGSRVFMAGAQQKQPHCSSDWLTSPRTICGYRNDG